MYLNCPNDAGSNPLVSTTNSVQPAAIEIATAKATANTKLPEVLSKITPAISGDTIEAKLLELLIIPKAVFLTSEGKVSGVIQNMTP